MEEILEIRGKLQSEELHMLYYSRNIIVQSNIENIILGRTDGMGIADENLD
jgi:hypothetical protein